MQFSLEGRDWKTDQASILQRIMAFAGREPGSLAPAAAGGEGDVEPACIPEVAAAEFNAGTLRKAVDEHGALIVRALLPCELAGELQSVVDAAVEHGYRQDSDDGFWYHPLEPREPVLRSQVLGNSRYFHRESGSVMAADSPCVAEALLQLYEDIGLRDTLRAYLGEEPCISMMKWVLRRSRLPIAESGWHQDGAFMGTDINTINMWLPLTRCGGDTGAPGMDVVPCRLHQIVSAEGATFDWSVSPDTVSRSFRGAAAVSPEFEPGDAFFFDQFYLHRTQFGKEFNSTRYAIETWFFGSDSFASNQVPLAW